jgi:hypothetical protein
MEKPNLYYYNSKNLRHEKLNKKQYSIIFGWLLILMVSIFLLGIRIGLESNKKRIKDNNQAPTLTKSWSDPIKDKDWIDSVFTDYKIRAERYLKRPIFKGTPIRPEILTLCARNAYDSTGILLPVELALAQAQWESSMGLEGKSPKNNPYNVGETDNGTVKYFKSTFDGVQSYYYLMCNNYLRCKSVESLLIDFTNCNGRRYASIETYESKMYQLYIGIKRWLDVELDIK